MLRPILLIILSSLCFSLMDGISKVLVADNDPLMIVWARYAVGLPVMAYLAWRHPRRMLASNRPLAQVLRAILPFVLSVAIIVSLSYLPLAETTAILFTMPLMLIPLAALLLRERVSAGQLAAVAVGFVGALIIIRPGAGALQWAALLALGAAFGAALMQIVTRWLRQGSDPLATFAYTIVVGFAVACLPLPWVWHSLSAGALRHPGVRGMARSCHRHRRRHHRRCRSLCRRATARRAALSAIAAQLLDGQRVIRKRPKPPATSFASGTRNRRWRRSSASPCRIASAVQRK